MLTAQTVYNIAVGVLRRFSSTAIDANELALLLTALVEKESTYRPDAKNSKSTARGLTQMLICTQRENERLMKIPFAPASARCSTLGAKEPVVSAANDKMYDPTYAMMLAAFYLNRQILRYKGDVRKGLHAYNQGSYNTKKPSASGDAYAADILRRRDKLRPTINENETLAQINLAWPAFV